MSSSSVDKNIVTPSPMAKYGSAIFLSIAIIVGSQSYEIVKETWFGLRACLETHLSIMKRFSSMLAMAI